LTSWAKGQLKVLSCSVCFSKIDDNGAYIFSTSFELFVLNSFFFFDRTARRLVPKLCVEVCR
jgi:hypothetical protein